VVEFPRDRIAAMFLERTSFETRSIKRPRPFTVGLEFENFGAGLVGCQYTTASELLS
jgi:hypothetical protein